MTAQNNSIVPLGTASQTIGSELFAPSAIVACLMGSRRLSSLATLVSGTVSGTGAPRRTLALAGLAHMLHDGLTDMIYVLLPVWQAQFGLGYAALAAMRGLYVGVLAAFQMPSGQLARHLGTRTVLALGTALTAAGFALAGLSGGLVGLCLALALAGAGGSTQHPLASAAVSHAYGRAARGPLGTYNFAGDLGKASLPPLLSLLLTMMGWRPALWIMAALGAAVALIVACLMPPVARGPEAPKPEAPKPEASAARHAGRGGFAPLLVIGVLDSAARMAFLLFLPFLLQAKGGSLTTVGIALSAVFIGGAFGKAVCGWLGARLGLLVVVTATEAGTAACILAVLALPLAPAMALLPLLGVMLNGTSSVLYGTVPELVARDRVEAAFALFYTGTLGSSALAPMLFGRLGDMAGPSWAMVAAAATALAVVPLMIPLAPRLASRTGTRPA